MKDWSLVYQGPPWEIALLRAIRFQAGHGWTLAAIALAAVWVPVFLLLALMQTGVLP